jgi:capsular exopolysaccharide synthesis family protein
MMGLIRALRRRLGFALVLGLVCALLGAGAAWLIVPASMYTTRGSVRVSMIRPKIIFKTAEAEADYKTFQRTQVAMMKSRLVLGAVLQDPKVIELKSYQKVLREQGDPFEWLEQNVIVDFPGNSELLQVSMSGPIPDDLAVVVNSVINKYMEVIVGREGSAHKDRVEKLHKLYEKYQTDLRSQREAMRKLALVAGSDDQQTLAIKSQFALETLALAKGEQLHIRTELIRVKADAAALEIEEKPLQREAVDDATIDEYIDRDEGVAQYNKQIAALSKRYQQTDRLMRNKSDPSLLAASRELQAARQGLARYREKLRSTVVARIDGATPNGSVPAGTRSQRQRLAARIKVLEQQDQILTTNIEQLTTQVQKLNENTLDLRTEQENIATLAETAHKVGAEVEALDVEREAPARIEPFDPAFAPKGKDETKKLKIIGMAAAGSFAFVLLGISFLEFRAQRIGSVEEVVHGLGLTLVGSIPVLPPARTRRWLTGAAAARAQDHHSQLVESVNATRTMLLHASRNHSIRVVLVTSALAGEGKTSLSGHLATSLARAGRRSLLIDCDLRRPGAHLLFEKSAEPGVCELLRGDAELADVIQTTRATDLSIIPAGRIDTLSIQALARGELQAIIDVLAVDYDFVIIDSAPVLAVSDTLLVSQHVDAVLFSILREVSRAPMVLAASERLASLGVRILGAVVAGTPSESYGTYYRQASPQS